jgi:hypothetical protein
MGTREDDKLESSKRVPHLQRLPNVEASHGYMHRPLHRAERQKLLVQTDNHLAGDKQHFCTEGGYGVTNLRQLSEV